MAGTKRGAEDGPATRASKVAKTDKNSSTSKPKKGGAKKAKVPYRPLRSRARRCRCTSTLPTRPPSLSDGDTVPAAPTDPGHLGSLTLVAKSFKTGSYGWTGSKRLTIELLNPEGGDKEKVNVMLTINATVLGSKDADGDKEEEKEEKDAEEPAEEEAAED
ncbi:hypothetical protein B0H14DRAFT_2807377 [Mycena olivaceomarginata]|nr:hypothetical protein B0H14DRAFT_2807377 [Mycena olivaceomarginata]